MKKPIKISALLLTMFITGQILAQVSLPTFLEGTWKMDNTETYENWDLLSDNRMKGFSYEIKDNNIQVSEYLDIVLKENEVIYTATVLSQNRAEGIDFRLTQTDNMFIFENPSHDFPKKIIYKKLADNEVFVQVSDGKQKGFSYTMKKLFDKSASIKDTSANPNYDSDLATKLGADDFGMKSYILVILKTGSNLTTDKAFISNAFRGHLKNIGQLVEQGKLIVAGPFGKNENTYRGIFILNVATIEEAKDLLQTDPAIKEQLLEAELYNWYGSAALPEYIESSDKIWKVKP